MGGGELARAEFEELAGYLTALANAQRLELLHILRVPRAIAELQLRPGRHDGGANPERPMSRTAIERHLAVLRAVGVVATREGERGGRAVDEYVLQHARLFQLVEELRGLTQLRPVDATDLDATVGDVRPVEPRQARGAHVALLSGPFEGRLVPLAGGGPWLVGRAGRCDIALDYDPFVSSQHARIHRVGDRFEVEDLPTNRNGTLVDWQPVPRGARAPLAPGDVLRVGRSLLVFRVPRARGI